MRDAVAGAVAILLAVVAASLATTLTYARRRRQRARDAERALGRTVVAEIPGGVDLLLFSKDAVRFYYGDQSIDKDLVVAVRLLINGISIAEARRDQAYRPARAEADRTPAADDVQADGIARDRWDVAIDTVTGTTMIACGAIRERVSQELARSVFDAVKHDLDLTTPSRARGRDD